MAVHRNRQQTILISVLLATLTVATFYPLARCDFINYDDPDYVTENDWVKGGLSWSGFFWAFRTAHAANWHPLTWLSHMLDVQCFGLNPAGHHLTNLFFHTANAVLLFLVLRRMTEALWRSAFVAALFALHPLHVESVAWISERKDVLSSFFFLLTLWAYTRYVEESKVGNSKFKVFYGLAVLLFALGLLSKPMLVTLPFVLLLLDDWPLGRMSDPTQPGLPNPIVGLLNSRRFWKLVGEKTPFFILSATSSIITFLVQRQGGAVESLERLPLDGRVANALAGYLAYIEKAICPTDLAIYYLRTPDWPGERVIWASLVLGGASIALLFFGGTRPYLRFGWMWFVGMLVPVIGLVQVGTQTMADRYTYLPLVGLFIIVAWGGAELMNRLARGRWAFIFAGAFALLGCAIATRFQVNCWRNSQSLFAHCISVTEGNFVAHNSLGTALAAEGKLEEAEAEYRKALQIQPYYADGLRNLGVVLTQQGKTADAMIYLREAIRIKPKAADVYGKLGFALAAEGKTQEAIDYYRNAVRLQPDLVEALNNLAWILAVHPDINLRNGSEAVRFAERACELTNYKRAIFVGTLAAAYAEAGRYDEAIATGERARAIATAAGQGRLAKRNEELLMLYRAGKPHRQETRSPVPSASTVHPN